MDKNFHKKHVLISTGILCLSIIILVSVALSFLSKKRLVHSILTNVDSKVSLDTKVTYIKKVISDNKEIFDLVGSSFLRQGEEVLLIAQTEKIAKDSGVVASIDAVSEDKTVDGGWNQGLSIKVQFSGDWNSVVNFVQNIEKMNYICDIKNLSYIRNDVSGKWTGILEFTAYKLK